MSKMDFLKLKVLFPTMVILLAAYANTAGVNSLELNSNLSTASPSSILQTVNYTPEATKDTPTTKIDIAPTDKAAAVGKVLADTKDATQSLASNSANLSEARITSITFRSEEGDIDASGATDKENTETISFGIRSFTVEVAASATEKPIPLSDDEKQLAQHVPIASYDEVLSERVKVFQPSGQLIPTDANKEKSKNQIKTSVNNGNDNVHDDDVDDAFDGFHSSGITIVPVKLTPSMQSETIVTATPASLSSINSNNNNNNEHEQLSISSNGMHVEQKLENGLYRIKIAEIITDEFNNGHINDEIKPNADEAIQNEHKINKIDSSMNIETPALNDFNVGQNTGQINIADLYPSKLEDFSSIIRESNEKLIKEKNRLVGVEKADDDLKHDEIDNNRFNLIDDGNEQENSIQFKGDYGLKNGKQQVNGALNSIENNIPTTKIEIELIDEPATSKDVKIIGPSIDDDDDDDYANPMIHSNDKVTDFTSKLQVNDELISKIEQSFRESSMTNVQQEEQHPPEPITINKPITPMGFIERRVKKFDPTMKKRLMENQRAQLDDIRSVTKSDADLMAENTISTSEQKDSETKFYNSKELYSELMHPNDSSTVKLNKTSHGINSPKKDFIQSTTSNGASDQKILFINVNSNGSKIDQKESERLQKAQEEIIKESKTMVEQNGNAVTTGPAKNMHLYIIHDDVLAKGQKSIESIKTNYKDNGNGPMATPIANSITTTSETTVSPTFPITRATETVVSIKTTSNESSSATTPVTTTTTTTTTVHAISSTESNLEQHSSSLNPIIETTTEKRTTQPLVTTTTATTTTTSTTTEPPSKPTHQSHFMTNYYQKQKSFGRRLYDGILLEADCDMQTPIPNDSNVWRGNETHELNLPTTVSFFVILILILFFALLMIEFIEREREKKVYPKPHKNRKFNKIKTNERGNGAAAVTPNCNL